MCLLFSVLEKMAALKKAYAEIILNTAKEGVAQIMVSERKAVRFEKDLNSSKDEALRLLVHLKQMIDSTTKEAELTSLTQQRKIDELDAQLHEAEDVITDLRSELRWVRAKLEKVRNNQLQPMNGQIKKEDTYAQKDVTVEPTVPSILDSQLETVTTYEMENYPLNLTILDNRNCSTTQQTENLSVTHLDTNDVHTPNLASTILRNKEPELCRNGFTQRLRTLERNLPNGKLPPLGGIDGQHTLVKNELIETSDEVVGNTAPSSKTTNVDIAKKYSGGEVKKLVKVCTSRRRKIRFGKAKASICRSRPGQPKKPSRLSSVSSFSKSYSVNENLSSEVSEHTPPSIKAGNTDNGKSYGDFDKKLLRKRSFNEEENKISQIGKENMRLQNKDATAASFLSPDQPIKTSQPSSRGVLYSFALRGNVKSGEDGLKTTENEAKMKPLLRLDPGLTLIRSGMDPVSGSKIFTVSVKVLNKSRLAQKTEEKDKELSNEFVLVKPDGDAVGNSMAVCSELIREVFNAPVLSELKDAKSLVDSDGSPSKPDLNRVLKYSFHRKRMKESMSNAGVNISPDKTIVKKRVAEKQTDAQEPEKSTLINESSTDSRRMAHVARQLISLSGR